MKNAAVLLTHAWAYGFAPAILPPATISYKQGSAKRFTSLPISRSSDGIANLVTIAEKLDQLTTMAIRTITIPVRKNMSPDNPNDTAGKLPTRSVLYRISSADGLQTQVFKLQIPGYQPAGLTADAIEIKIRAIGARLKSVYSDGLDIVEVLG